MTLPLTPSCLCSVAVVETECERSSATTYFWYRETLDISNSISESGGLNWKMTLCLLVAWSLVGLAMIKGIQSSGKVGIGGHLSLAGLCPGNRNLPGPHRPAVVWGTSGMLCPLGCSHPLHSWGHLWRDPE